MKNSLVFILLFASTILCSIVLPWWIIAPLALAFTYFAKTSRAAGFLIPLASVFLAWLLSIYFVDNGSVSDILGKLFGISAFYTPIVAAIIGGITAGLFGWAGSLLSPGPKVLVKEA